LIVAVSARDQNAREHTGTPAASARGRPGPRLIAGRDEQADDRVGTGFLTRDGHLQIHVRGLVLADSSAVPAGLRGTNPVADFEAIVSCQTITGGMATVTNITTRQFHASPAGNADIRARVKLPEPCIAPVVFVASPTGAWFAATGS
jgi:hypothetical protein